MPDTHIAVFWDVDECPNPVGFDHCSIYESIVTSLKKEGFRIREHSFYVMAYDEKNTIPEGDWSDWPNGFTYQPNFGDSRVKYGMMFKDMIYWAKFNQAPSTMIVISKKNISENKDLAVVLKSFLLRDYIIFLAHSVLPTPTSVWLSREVVFPADVEAIPII